MNRFSHSLTHSSKGRSTLSILELISDNFLATPQQKAKPRYARLLDTLASLTIITPAPAHKSRWHFQADLNISDTDLLFCGVMNSAQLKTSQVAEELQERSARRLSTREGHSQGN